MSSCLKILLRYPLAARQQPRFKLRLTAIVVAAFLLWHFINSYKNFRYDIPHTDPPASVDKETQLSCDSLQGLGDIFLILRTGASEALRRLPAHFNTTLRCLHSQNYGIWSDYEEYIGGHHVHDAFDEMDPEVIASHPDFAYYRRLKEQGRSSFTVDELTGWATAPNSAGGRDTPGWKLDKWKFLPIADKAYRQQPNAKWYIFMEGDTYIHWANILHWLSHIDASKPYYMGQEMQIGDIVFAYGGSSFVISNSAMKTLVEYRATKPGVYEEFTGNHWAGDCVLGKAMLDAGIKLSWQYPNLFGGMPYDMDYNETFGSPQRRLWCYPTTTYHHVSPSDVEEIYHNEQKWNQEARSVLTHRPATGRRAPSAIAMSLLLELPRELRDIIISHVILSPRSVFDPAQVVRERENVSVNSTVTGTVTPEHMWVGLKAVKNPALPLLFLNRQLMVETLEVIARLPSRPVWQADVLVTEDCIAYPTWTCVPYLPADRGAVDALHVKFRIEHDMRALKQMNHFPLPPNKRSPVYWQLYDLLVMIPILGPRVKRHDQPPSSCLTIHKLILDFEGTTQDKWLAYRFAQFAWDFIMVLLNEYSRDRQWAVYLFERVGDIEIHVYGSCWTRVDISQILSNPDNMGFGTFPEGRLQHKQRLMSQRKEARLPVSDPENL
ncbi:hypothetical protein SCUP515_07001 [Seiridium cupressi]